MKVLKRLKYFLLLDIKTKLIFIEAFIFLGWARILKEYPFSKVAPSIRRTNEGNILYDIDESNKKISCKHISSS